MNEENISEVLSEEAWRLRNESRLDEALVLINLAIEHNPDYFDNLNIKAIILYDLGEYEKSIEFYDKAYELSSIDTIIENKAMALYKWALKLHFPDNDLLKALDVIDEALKIKPDENEFWFLKGEILDGLNKPIEARMAYYRAEGEMEKLEDLKNQIELFESQSNLINVTGTNFYKGLEPFRKGVILDLIKEDDNPHDPDAVRVEIDGECVGYVANSDFTVIDGVLSASDLKSSDTQAEVLMIYLGELVIARLI